MAKYTIEERLSWRGWVTPKPLEDKPIHRWYVFPHSFSSELVHKLIEEWNLGPKDHILDPFAGAGTTILAAKERGVPASGYDLSPLAVLAARTKVTNYNVSRIEKAWKSLEKTLDPAQWNGVSRPYPKLVEKALPGRLLGGFDTVARHIDYLSCSNTERDFFRLALLTTVPVFSRAVATGGWLKWVKRRNKVTHIPSVLAKRAKIMLDDLHKLKLLRRSWWRVGQADARQLPDENATYSAVISSPPYPNRHDYTRVFGVELMFGLLDWEKTRQLRYQSFHSHPEARPDRPDASHYTLPKSLGRAIMRIREADEDPRISPMLEGYFLDMYLCLREIKRVCRSQAKIALVVGNAQYCGESIPVDELTAEIGEQVGLTCEKILVARYRGNSAQQMGKYGRIPSRESIVVLRNS
jgi:site-specific DNA-methyltransferase (cytosine-N4-specific)